MSDETIGSEVGQAANAALEAALDDEHVTFEIEGETYDVVAMKGSEKVSELFRFDLTLEGDAIDATPFELLGQSCVMTIHDGFGTRVTLQGLIAEAERTVRDNGKTEVLVTMRPNQFPLSLSRDSRVFIDKTVPEIVDRVLEKMKTKSPYRWELTRSYRQRVYTAQYREADWLFVSRLLEEEGIYYWFDHEADDTVLVFSDDSVHAPKLTGNAPLEFLPDTGMSGERELIHELAAEAHATATKFTVGSFDPWNPSLKVMATEGDGVHEMYDAPGGGPEDPAVCAHIAKNRLECALSHRATVSGNSTSVRIDPGRIMEVFNHPIHDGQYFVTEVVYDVTQRRRFMPGAENTYSCHFEAVYADRAFRPPEDTPVSKQAGFQSGRVVGPPGEEIHTDERGRVRVQLHWDREGGWDDRAGKWMRVSQRGVSMSMMYPRTGWNVMTFMEEGNVNAPMVLNRVHDAEHPPTYSLPDNKTKTVWRTMTSPADGTANELRFEDLFGLQEMFINATGVMNYSVNKDMGQNVGRNHEKKVGGNQILKVGQMMQADVQHDQKAKVGGDEELEITDDREKGVGGNEKEEITGNREIEVGSNLNHTVDKKRALKVTGAVTEEAKKGLIKVSAGGATKVKIDGSVKQTVDGVVEEILTGKVDMKVTSNVTETCKESYGVTVDHDILEHIGGNLMMEAGEHFMDGATNTGQWSVGSYIRATTSKDMYVQAQTRIVLRCGQSSVEITPKNITIRAASYDLSNSETTVAVTKQIKHN